MPSLTPRNVESTFQHPATAKKRKTERALLYWKIISPLLKPHSKHQTQEADPCQFHSRTTSISPPGLKTSVPPANASINSPKRVAPKSCSFLISSKSSLKASETEAIQNCRKRSFISCSFNSRSPLFEFPGTGRKEGRSAGGGDGEDDKCLRFFGADAPATFNCVFVFAALRDASELEEEESDESESESESDDELEEIIGLCSDVGGCADSLLEGESEEESDSELETAALLFRFLVLFLGAGAMQSCCERTSEAEKLWQAANVDIKAIEIIISSHFRTSVGHHACMDNGSYARVFLFTLENGMQVIARIILPVRESVKTEAEVAAMELVRARTSIPVPKVYLYCSTPENPVRAEWILMEYMPGLCLADGFEQLTYEQKRRTATDLAKIMFSLFNITSAECGSISPYSGDRSDESLCHNSLRYPLFTPLFSPRLTPTTLKGQSVMVGPINDITFLDYPRQVDPQRCGPFNSERSVMEAFAFLGTPPTRPGGKLSCWVFEKTLEVYDVVKQFYNNSQQSEVSSSNHDRFHFAHGDLSSFNILIDPSTGAVTGIIDWEMAGFRPAWLAAVGGGWFDDDSERFLMSDFQNSRGNHADETPADAVLRAHFRLRLATLDAQLFRHHLQGIELRALLYACCNEFDGNTEMWLEKYKDQEWVVARRGDFPFDFIEWLHERFDLEDSLRGRRRGVSINAILDADE